MKKLALGALFVGLFAACGGGGDSKKVSVADGGVDDIGQCNPLTQSGCAAGEKCTWIVDALMPQYVGHIGCAMDGSANVGDSCTFGAAGASGYDNCKKGSVCGNYRGGTGICKTICDQQGGQPACDAEHVCVTYSGLFSSSESTPPAGGVCDLACDPINDNDFDGSGAGTKTGTKCGANDPTVGCYGAPSGGTAPATGWSCTNDINSTKAQDTGGFRHRTQCTMTNGCASMTGTVYLNSCNQGYLPLLKESSTVSTTICVSLCKPASCSSGACGTNDVNRKGIDGNACKTPDRMGQFTNNSTFTVGATTAESGGETCTYLWWFELDNNDMLLRSPTSDSVGFCFDHSKYLALDTDNNGMADMPYPNCGKLAIEGSHLATDIAKPYVYLGAADLGCVTSTEAGFPAAQGKAAAHVNTKVLMDRPRMLYHGEMDAR